METPAEEFADGPVRLRRWRRSDADGVFRAVNAAIDHLQPWMPWVADGYGESDAAEFVERSHLEWERGEAFGYAVLDEAGAIIGSCSLMTRIGDGGLEIGYWLDKSHTGRGIITRAVALLTEEAFRLGANRVEIVHDAANVRSGAVPARLGFTEIARKPKTRAPSAPGECGIDVIWRREA